VALVTLKLVVLVVIQVVVVVLTLLVYYLANHLVVSVVQLA
jgi:hypothetical protein